MTIAAGTRTPSSAAKLPRVFRLSNGRDMPAFGLGTYQAPAGEISAVIDAAIDAGYTHFDCAAAYQNEAEIGAALASSSVPREKIFVTSKLWNTYHRPNIVPQAVDKTRGDLGLDYLDLYLMHWPMPMVYMGPDEWFPKEDGKILHDDDVTLEQTWAAMEKLVDEGKVKSIGVSNFNIPRLERILKVARIKPAVNQVELHPYLPQLELFEFCKKNGILLTAYSPFGCAKEPRILDDPVLNEVAKKNGKSVAQVILSWSIQRGTSVIPKSANPSRIRENIAHFVLPEADMNAIDALGERKVRYIPGADMFQRDVFECP